MEPDIEENMIMLGKLTGFPKWPCLIMNENDYQLEKGPKKGDYYLVQFFDDGKFAWLPKKDLLPYTENVGDLIKTHSKNKRLLNAIEDANRHLKLKSENPDHYIRIFKQKRKFSHSHDESCSKHKKIKRVQNEDESNEAQAEDESKAAEKENEYKRPQEEHEPKGAKKENDAKGAEGNDESKGAINEDEPKVAPYEDEPKVAPNEDEPKVAPNEDEPKVSKNGNEPKGAENNNKFNSAQEENESKGETRDEPKLANKGEKTKGTKNVKDTKGTKKVKDFNGAKKGNKHYGAIKKNEPKSESPKKLKNKPKVNELVTNEDQKKTSSQAPEVPKRFPKNNHKVVLMGNISDLDVEGWESPLGVIIGEESVGMDLIDNIIEAGYTIYLTHFTINEMEFDRRIGNKESVKILSCVEEVFESCATVLLSLADYTQIRTMFAKFNIMNGDAHVLNSKGIINVTLMEPDSSIELSDFVESRGGAYLEVAVFGTKIEILRGSPLLLAEGNKELFHKSLLLFNYLGRRLYYFGIIG